MKKFVLRVLAVLMVAAMMVPSMGNVTTALADEAVTLDLTQKGLIVGEAPTDNADGYNEGYIPTSYNISSRRKR